MELKSFLGESSLFLEEVALFPKELSHPQGRA
jgi:hypothetical protein